MPPAFMSMPIFLSELSFPRTISTAKPLPMAPRSRLICGSSSLTLQSWPTTILSMSQCFAASFRASSEGRMSAAEPAAPWLPEPAAPCAFSLASCHRLVTAPKAMLMLPPVSLYICFPISIRVTSLTGTCMDAPLPAFLFNVQALFIPSYSL